MFRKFYQGLECASRVNNTASLGIRAKTCFLSEYSEFMIARFLDCAKNSIVIKQEI